MHYRKANKFHWPTTPGVEEETAKKKIVENIREVGKFVCWRK